MSGERFMLDTDIFIFILRGLKVSNPKDARRKQAERIRNRMEQQLRDGAVVHVSMVTVCELEYGAARASDPAKERRALYNVLAPFELIGCDTMNLPRHYGEVRHDLDREGQPIDSMDLLIAAHARSVGATLVTNNGKKFGKVKGLRVTNWADEE